MRKYMNVCKVSDGYLCTITETRHVATETDVKALIRHEGLRHNETALNEVYYDSLENYF